MRKILIRILIILFVVIGLLVGGYLRHSLWIKPTPEPAKEEPNQEARFGNGGLTILATITSGNCSLCDPLNYTHTTDAGTDLLVVTATASGAGNAVATWNGVAMSLAITDSNHSYSWIFYLVNPDIGTYTVSIDATESARLTSVAINFSGSNTASPIGTTQEPGQTTSDTVTNTATTGGTDSIVIDSVYWATTGEATVGANQTERLHITNNAASHRLASTEPAASPGSVTMSWTGTSAMWVSCFAEIKGLPVAAAPSEDPPQIIIMD